MSSWLIEELAVAELSEEIKRKLTWAIAQADTIGELFLGVVVVHDDGKEYVVMDKRDFESWYDG
jgi:hypothetical protein